MSYFQMDKDGGTRMIKKCYRCHKLVTKNKNKEDRELFLGTNIFDASTGTHITTRWYCMFCANIIGLVTAK